MDQQNGHGALQPPRRVLQMQRRLDGARDESRLAVQEQERDHADERREHDRQRDERAERLPAREVEPLEQKREGNPDRRGEDDAHQRNPHARPERSPLTGTRDERAHGGSVGGIGPDDEDGIDDEPGEQQRERDGRQVGVSQAPDHNAMTRVAST